ncbi:MAG: hypothetical protein H6837_17750 [Planctomycetes bacterium]|nr:hypothetical protein [Planctomycetota bacterium]
MLAQFVENMGQWDGPFRFARRFDGLTAFVSDHGWSIELREGAEQWRRPSSGRPGFRAQNGQRAVKCCALRMEFLGANETSSFSGSVRSHANHNFFLGNDPRRWRAEVPCFAEVLSENVYPGVSVRMHGARGQLEYDLLLDPGADLSRVCILVEGARGIRIENGDLIIETSLGDIRQPRPATWIESSQRSIVCNYEIRGPSRFGFVAPGWKGENRLIIDPELVWSTLLGGRGFDIARAVDVDRSGLVTVTGETQSINFPTTLGAYDRTFNGTGSSTVLEFDIFVSRLDPRSKSADQLVHSTYLGGKGNFEVPAAVSVDGLSIVTLVGATDSADFPVTNNAYKQSYGAGLSKGFACQIDPRASGLAQLRYSSFLGGSSDDVATSLHVDSAGVMVIGGSSNSADFPVTPGAFATSIRGGEEGFVLRLDTRRVGTAQLVYSTFFGGSSGESVNALDVDLLGRITLGGSTTSADFPTTAGARDRVLNGASDGYLLVLDATRLGPAQLLYSSYLGGKDQDSVTGLVVGPVGQIVAVGSTHSTDFPASIGAVGPALKGGRDAFVVRIDPSAPAPTQLGYSTFLGGGADDAAFGVCVDSNGHIVVGGSTMSIDFPTTAGAYSPAYLGNRDAFVARIDAGKKGLSQLSYASYVGGAASVDSLLGLHLDESDTAFLFGNSTTSSTPFPTTLGAYSQKTAGGLDLFVCRVALGVPMFADRHRLLTRGAGVQNLTVQAGQQNARRTFQIFGALSTKPGVAIDGVTIPLNPDAYTRIALSGTNSPTWTGFRGTLDANGEAQAAFHLPPDLISTPPITLYHALVVFDSAGRVVMASHAVPLEIGHVEVRR